MAARRSAAIGFARADAIRQDFGAKIHVHEWVQAPNLLDDAVTVINTTALGNTDPLPA